MTSAAKKLDHAESALQEALRQGDVDALEGLLDPDVVLVGPDGFEVSRAEDLRAHRTGAIRLEEVTELSRATRQFGDTGTTRVRLHLRGVASGASLDAEVVYTRTWHFDGQSWRVVQAHGSLAKTTAL